MTLTASSWRRVQLQRRGDLAVSAGCARSHWVVKSFPFIGTKNSENKEKG